MIRVVILDFDGVVLESVGIKTEAFGALFSDYPEHVEAIMRYHLQNGAVSRYIKFRHIHERILGQPYDAARERQVGERFSALVFERLVACAWVPGAREMLEEFSARFPLYVVSAAPEEELRRIVEARGMGEYFRAVYGTPATKPENIRRILAAENAAPDEAVMVGDARKDYEAASEVGVPFIGRRNEEPFDDLGVPVHADLFGVAEELRRLAASVAAA